METRLIEVKGRIYDVLYFKNEKNVQIVGPLPKTSGAAGFVNVENNSPVHSLEEAVELALKEL